MRLGEVSDDHFVNALLEWMSVVAGDPARWFCLVGKNSGPESLPVCERARSPASTWFDELSEHGSSRLKIVFQTQHGLSDAARFRSGEADDADPAAAGRRGDGDDGIVKVHGEIVAAEGRGE